MTFKNLALYLERLEKTPSRLEITRILTELFKSSNPDEIDKVIYLSLGILAPNYESTILNLAEKMMLRVIADAFGISPEKIKREYRKRGDLGDTAEFFSQKASGVKVLSVDEVYLKLLEIAKDNGEGSQLRKIERLSNLLKSLDPLSVRYVSRIPVGRLRLGFSEKTIIDALAKVSDLDSNEIEKAYNIRPDIGYIGKVVLENSVNLVKPKLGVPVVPMLAQRINSTADLINKMGEVSVEPKFDGLRIFIHFRKKDKFLRIFTRNMNAIPESTFPELSEISKYIKADEVILDTEAVGVDPERAFFLDFQKTMQRRRKHNIEKTSGEIPLQFQVFDVLLIDGKSLIHEPYLKRREEIEKAVVDGSLLRVDENTITTDPETVKKLHQKYLKMGLEGIIAKKANGPYVSGRTGWNWVKMKEEEGKTGKLSDTIDCVIMGYTGGKGKRVGFGVGQFLAGVRDGDIFKTVTKVGTGLTDEQFRELNSKLKDLKTKEQPKEYLVHKDLFPDIWVIPQIVVELAADEITKSPKHTAGLALRFPRLVKFRDDKSPREVTEMSELQNLLEIAKHV